MKNIQIANNQFVDSQGRQLLLRGINVAGSSKIPYTPCIPTYKREDFFSGDISFVGRPFPLKEAHEHFSRLSQWGFRFLRFLVTWEAIEHKGPGEYDYQYIDFIHQLATIAQQYDINMFIDPHQDVWSRYTGGDGAPRWTLEKIGFDVGNIHPSGAAIVHNIHGDPFPKMIWPKNYTLLACATMFTLFFAGNAFAPNLYIDDKPVQEYLQNHYINAIKQLSARLKDLPNVVGFDTLNEPSRGWIATQELNKIPPFYPIGHSPTPFQSMIAGMGITQEAPVYQMDKITGKKTINPRGIKAWQNNTECIWKEQGVWDFDDKGKPVLLQPDYFNKINGTKVDFLHDFFKPFAVKFARKIQSDNPQYIIFLETIVENRQLPQWDENDPENMANADHWYDEATLLTKEFSPHRIFLNRKGIYLNSKEKIEKEFNDEIAELKKQSENFRNGIPTIIGEFGIPFDMHNKAAYRTGNFREQALALNRSFKAMENNLISCTLWNYTPDNSNLRGDQWNDEDLSVFSRDQQTNTNDINSGARAIEAFARPYPYRIAGKLLSYSFDIDTKLFTLSFEHDESIQAPSEIFIPPFHYDKNYSIEITDGTYEKVHQKQLLIYYHSKKLNTHQIIIKPNQ